ncbi:hypothetical protein SRABI121_00555 [Microbacterium sp. Bi121]|nr:hypothetical protein SRABI121_00555 [Microbacterium sp. Bi121]
MLRRLRALLLRRRERVADDVARAGRLCRLRRDDRRRLNVDRSHLIGRRRPLDRGEQRCEGVEHAEVRERRCARRRRSIVCGASQDRGPRCAGGHACGDHDCCDRHDGRCRRADGCGTEDRDQAPPSRSRRRIRLDIDARLLGSRLRRQSGDGPTLCAEFLQHEHRSAERSGAIRGGDERPVEPLGQPLSDQRDMRGPADEQDVIHLVRPHLRVVQSALEGLHRAIERRVDHRVELRAGDPHARAAPGQGHGDGGVGVERERLLGRDARSPQPCKGHAVAGIRNRRAISAGGHADGVLEHEVVEQRAPGVRQGDRLTDDPILRRSVLAQHGRLERLATQVVDRGDAARRQGGCVHVAEHPLVVMQSSCRRRHQVSVLEPGVAERCAQRIDPMRTPRRRVRDRENRGPRVVPLGEPCRPRDQRGGQLGRGDRARPGDEGHVVADIADERADEVLRVGEAALLCDVAEQQIALGSHIGERGEGAAPVPQHLGVGVDLFTLRETR